MSLKKGSTFVKVAHSYGVKETVKNIPYSTRLFKKRLVKFNAPYCCNIGFFRVKIKQLPGAGSPDLFPPQQLGKKTNVLCQIAKIGIPFPFLFSTFFCLFRFCRKINEMFCLDVKWQILAPELQFWQGLGHAASIAIAKTALKLSFIVF